MELLNKFRIKVQGDAILYVSPYVFCQALTGKVKICYEKKPVVSGYQ